MSIRYLKKHAALEGVVTVEDAEPLLQWLRTQARPAVHLGRCEHLHAAVLQVLLVLRPKLVALPGDPWLTGALAGIAGGLA
jgi:hypothetical protein